MSLLTELNSTTRGVVYQSLPASDSLNTSLYFVYAGFQDYFFPMYYQTMTPTEALDIVDAVVDSIVAAIQVLSILVNLIWTGPCGHQILVTQCFRFLIYCMYVTSFLWFARLALTSVLQWMSLV